jgi:hypothetical protein
MRQILFKEVIVHCGEYGRTQYIVTSSGSYLNIYRYTRGMYDHVDCKARENDFYNTTVSDLIDQCESFLSDYIKEQNNA